MNDFPDVFKLFDAGFVASNNHPVVDQLEHPVFKQLLHYTDRFVIILNHTNLEYVYVSDSVKTVVGFSPQEWKEMGVAGASKLMHQDDLATLGRVVFPAYFESLSKLSLEDKLRSKFTYTYRIRNKAGKCLNIVQENVILRIENEKITLGLVICTDASAFRKTDEVCYSHVLVRHPEGRVVLMENSGNSAGISTAEVRVLKLMSRGFSEKQIADKLNLSLSTIKKHKGNMMEKTGVRNSAELVRYAAANLLI
ncbi:MAG TPA: LuxR C-terminal-related transcriptional regulator [Cyclobacteriaceae bacterium]|nr:LuxR C-terminal-related transcriptional regulator [Cyclobacteriaceae bacterium]